MPDATERDAVPRLAVVNIVERDVTGVQPGRVNIIRTEEKSRAPPLVR